MRAFLALLACLMVGSACAAETKPNIVYFLIDDMGYADTGFNGCKDIKTPNFDKFAKQGAVLDCLYGQPVCSPTRACLMTGRYPVRTGVYNTVQYRLPKPWSLPLAERTLAQTLHDERYTTAMIGKWHLGDDSPDYMPTRRGFDHQYGFMGGSMNSFVGGAAGRKKTPGDWYRDDKQSPEEGFSMHLLAKEACRLIREQPAGKPLFLYVAPHEVHTPWLSPEENQKPYGQLSKRRKELAAATAVADEAFGQIMSALDEKGLADNTLVIFSSDNGGTSWDKVSDNGPLRGGKSDIYEGGFRLGAFAWCPGKIPAGIHIAEPLHVVDWYPTLAKLAGATSERKQPLDGKDILPVLTQGAKTPHEEILLIGSRPGQQAIRVGDWKLLINPAEFRSSAKSEPVELYNLAEDLGEKHNLAAANPERVKAMQARLQTYIAGSANGGYHKVKERLGAEAE
ncbi:MAG: sulfatase-like hydrolase/transferase [Chthoniobacteraceae bacterium]